MAHIQSINITADGNCTATIISSRTGDTISITIPGDALEGRTIDDRWAIVRERAERHVAALTGVANSNDRRQPTPFVYRGKVYPLRKLYYKDPQEPFSETKCSNVCEDTLWQMLAADAVFIPDSDICEDAQRILDGVSFFTSIPLYSKQTEIMAELQIKYPHYKFERIN